MDKHLEQALARLVGRGFTYLPVDESLVVEATEAYKDVMQQLGVFSDQTAVTQQRRGEMEKDLGLIFRPGGTGQDLKYCLHIAKDLDLAKILPLVKSKEPFLLLQELYGHINQLAYEVAVGLSTGYPAFFPGHLPQLVASAASSPRPYNTNTLRCLYYPQAPEQTGAKLHIDRSFLTFHLGDYGGKLLAREDEDGGEETIVSPIAGEALIFFGVKVIYPTQGKLRPLWHRSTTDGGVRNAMVQFVHADFGVEVTTASDSYRDYFKNHD